MAVKRDKIIANAEKLVAKGKIEQAIKEYERLLADSPGDVNTLNRIGDLWVRINRTPEAVKVFREIADRYSKDGFFLKAIAIYKKINKLDPSQLLVYGELAELYAKQGLAMEAKSQYQVLADYHLKQGDPANALAVYRKIAELDPNSINVHVKLADLYSQNGQVREALAEYDRVGKMLMKRGMIDEALQVFRKALKIDPKNIDLAASLVGTLLEARDFDNAISLLESTLEKNPGSPKLVSLLGRTHLSQGDTKSARSVLETGLAANPTDLSLRTVLSELHLKEGSPDDALAVLGPVADSLAANGDAKAVELLNKIISAEPLHTPTLAMLVEVYKALRQETSVLAAMNSLAEAYIAVQDFTAASSTLDELIKREPQNAQHKDKLAFVRKSLGVEVEEPEEVPDELDEVAEKPPDARPAVEEFAEAPDLDLSSMPDVDIDLDASQSVELDFGEPEAEEPKFGEAEETPAGLVEEDVDFITEHLTEAEVFAKYGLSEKAIEHLETILGRSPDHIETNERLVRILIDEGQKEKACPRAAHLLGLYQGEGDDGAFDKWFNDLIGSGFAVSPGPPVEVEVIAEGVTPKATPTATRPVPAIREPEQAVAEEPEITLDFEDLPESVLEASSVDFEDVTPEPPVPEEPEVAEEAASLDFEDVEDAGKPEEELAVDETVEDLEFGEEAAEELSFEIEEPETPEEEVPARVDSGDEPAASVPEIEEVAELDFGTEEDVSLEFGEPEDEAGAEESVAELDFEEEAEVGAEEVGAEIEEAAELDFGEEELPVPEPEPLAAVEKELDFDMAEPTPLGGPPVEELGELDFYIEQELFDEARTKLDTLLERYSDSEDLAERRQRIDEATAPPPPE
jgi:tetratricopeptide (TPR) repeat protein